MPSPQKDHGTGLIRRCDPHGFTEVCTSFSSVSVLTVTQPLSIEEQFDKSEERLLTALALLRSQRPYLNAAWHAKYCASGERFFKFVDDNVRDGTRRTLPKTNERDRRNQPVPGNVIGRHFGTFTPHGNHKQ